MKISQEYNYDEHELFKKLVELEKEGHGDRDRRKRGELNREETAIHHVNCYKEVK